MALMSDTHSVFKAVKFGDPAFRANPYPTYAWLRQNAPIIRVKAPFGFGKAYMITRYEDVQAVFKDPRFSTDMRRRGSGDINGGLNRFAPRSMRILGNQMVTQDDPNHARLKNLVHKAFTPARIASLHGRIEVITKELLDDAERRDTIDIVEDFALPLPMTVISEMLGVPEDRRKPFRDLMTGMLDEPGFALFRAFRQFSTTRKLIAFLNDLINLRRREPDDRMITALIEAEQSGDKLDQEELIGMVFVLLLAGHETTVNLIANGTLALLENPDQFRLLRDNPQHIKTAIEEFLRFTNPVEHGVVRFASEDLDVLGVTIPKGSTVMAMLSSANRDETVFKDPDRLDITRDPNRHLAFGVGMHYCLGAPLARMEGAIAINALLARFPNMRLAIEPQQVRWRPSIANFRGLMELPVALA
jgi:cytochrome P450 PksS